MRAVIQRVSSASVSVDGEMCSRIGKGFLILLGIRDGDTEETAEFLAAKCAGLRVFEDENGKMNISPKDAGAQMLVVSNFTLYGDTSHGHRPNFSAAAKADVAKPLYEHFAAALESNGFCVELGVFGADMKVDIHADGPVTVFMDSETMKNKEK